MELLIVVSLLGIVSLAVYGSLSAGVRIWRQVSSEERTGDLSLAWKRLQKDIRGQLKYRALPFVGQETEVSFPALVSTEGDKREGGRHDEVGRVRYYHDASCRCLCREKVTYVDFMKGMGGECLPVFSSVVQASFEYYGQETEREGPGFWNPEWRKDFPPLAVRLKVTLEEGIEKQFTALLP